MATTPTPPRKTRFGKQRLAAGGSLLVLALLALILRTAVTNPPGDSLNVLLITLDTTRADRLGCYGCRWAHTPALDGLARAGWKFENAFTQVPFTLPAHATILTGRYPAGHGLRDNESGGLPGGIGTLPEIFREHGYATAAFVASFTLDKRFGLGRGFDLYDDRPDESSRGRELPANTVAGRALAWMEKNAGRPFFCWIHFFDPHFPYDPPSAYLGAGIDPYDGEIAFMDAQIGRILDFLDRRGLSGRTLVVAAGDHGEALGEHGENEHGLLVYEGSMRVPLILRIPGRTGGIDVGRAAGLVDLAPSVLDALGWPLPAGMAGQSLLDDGSGPGECYGESLFGFYSHRWAPLYSLTTSRWRYIQGSEAELYDRRSDHAERINLVSRRPETAAAMARRLHEIRGAAAPPAPAEPGGEIETVRRLRALGYLGAGTRAPDAPAADRPAPAPREMVAVHNDCRRARRLLDLGRSREAVDLLAPRSKLDPASPTVLELLAEGCLALGDIDRARNYFEGALTGGAGDRAILADLGTVALYAGRFSEAAEILGKALDLPGDDREPRTPSGVSRVEIKIRVNLSAALIETGQLDEAEFHCLRALGDAPELPQAGNCLARIRALRKEAGPKPPATAGPAPGREAPRPLGGKRKNGQAGIQPPENSKPRVGTRPGGGEQ